MNEFEILKCVVNVVMKTRAVYKKQSPSLVFTKNFVVSFFTLAMFL